LQKLVRKIPGEEMERFRGNPRKEEDTNETSSAHTLDQLMERGQAKILNTSRLSLR
jgi:hypothetical protein